MERHSILHRLFQRETGCTEGKTASGTSGTSVKKPRLRSLKSAKILRIEQVIDLIPPLKEEVMLGFTRDGKFIISYKHDEHNFYLQLWPVDGLFSGGKAYHPALRCQIFSHLPQRNEGGTVWEEPYITLWQLPKDNCLVCFAHHESGALYASAVPTLKLNGEFVVPEVLDFKLSCHDGILPHPTCIGCDTRKEEMQYSFAFKTIDSVAVMQFSVVLLTDEKQGRCPEIDCRDLPGLEICHSPSTVPPNESATTIPKACIKIRRIEGLLQRDLEIKLGISIKQVGIVAMHPDGGSAWITVGCHKNSQPAVPSVAHHRTSWIDNNRSIRSVKSRTYTQRRQSAPAILDSPGKVQPPRRKIATLRRPGPSLQEGGFLQMRWHLGSTKIDGVATPSGADDKVEAKRLRTRIFNGTKPELLCRVADNSPLLEQKSLQRLVNPVFPLVIQCES